MCMWFKTPKNIEYEYFSNFYCITFPLKSMLGVKFLKTFIDRVSWRVDDNQITVGLELYVAS